MPRVNIAKSQIIKASISKVYNAISDMSTWQHWSPWIILDKSTTVNVTNNNKSYDWTGDRVGAGNMHISSESQNEYVNYDLNLLKPWKSSSKVKMEVSEHTEGTQVTWHMDSMLPWFMFWMKNMMTTYIGMDYDRGLLLLKDYVELGAVTSKINELGESQYPGCNYLAIKRSCTIADMPKYMQQDFEKLMPYAHSHPEMRPQDAFSIYHKFDAMKGVCEYTAGVPYNSLPSDLPTEYSQGSIPSCKIYTVEHVGPYHHLGNAWAMLQNMIRGKELKIIKNIHPFETYGNSPKDTAPNDLISRISFAVKS